MNPPLLRGSSAAGRAVLIAALWLLVISTLHWVLNSERPVPQRLRMGYMPVVTNLAAPLLDSASKTGAVRFEAIKFASFAEMAEAFRSGHIEVAFIIAPLAIAMYEQGVPLKVVYIGNRNESTLVVRPDVTAKDLGGLAGKTVAVPIRFSGHMLAIRRYLRGHGLDPDSVRTVEIPPPDMPAALATGGIDGYFVGEPFACKSLQSGAARRLLDVESIWPGFICNLMIVRDEVLKEHPDWVQRLVTGAARSGLWVRDHLDAATGLIASYWGQDPALVAYTFSHPPGRFRFDRFTPVVAELQDVAQEMLQDGLLSGPVAVEGMTDDRFAREVDPASPVHALQDIFP